MLTFLSEKRAAVLAALLLLGFLLLLSVQVRLPDAGAAVQSGLMALFAPVARGTASSTDSVTGMWRRYVALRGLEAENASLRARVAELELEARALEEAAGESDRMRELLGLQRALTLPTVAARVILVELAGPFRVAVLDRGSRHGIQVDDAVITPAGVVGRVTSVSPSACKVQLLIDSSSGAAAMVARTRVQGMVVGRGMNELGMQYVAALSDVEPGDSVDTSGLDGIYPKGFRIGLVATVGDSEGLQRQVVIRTAVDFRTLEEVLVVVGGEGEPAPPVAAR